MKWTQKIISLFFISVILKIFFKLKVEGVKEIEKIKPPLLIIGNHKSFWDTFALGAVFPLRTKLFPVRIMGEAQYFFNWRMELLRKTGLIKLVYFIFGVFPAIRGSGLKTALKKPVQILKNKGIVFIHPEGMMIRDDEIGKFKIGAAALALETKTKILPVVFKMSGDKFRKEYFIKFGDVFSLSPELTPEQGTNFMRKIIVDLYKILP